MNTTFKRLPTEKGKQLGMVLVVIAVGAIGAILINSSHAASPYSSVEASSGTLTGEASIITDPNASNGSAIQFGSGSTGTSGGNCPGLPNGTAAFCDDFTNETPPAVSRSGPLSAVWGVSRINSYSNASEGWNDLWSGVTLGAEDDAATSYCGAKRVIADADIAICSGVPGIVETTNDGSGYGNTGGTDSILAAYPRQPFDISSGTGTAVFSATDNTEGGHGAWPTWVYTDQPVPAPNGFLPPQACPTPSQNCDTSADAARNAVGVDFDGINGTDQSQIGVLDIWMTSNYTVQLMNITIDNYLPISTIETGMDHFKIQLNASGIDVYGEAYNGSSYVLLANGSFNANGNPPLPLTRGLTWMEDVHYNADKFSNFPLGDGGVYDQSLNSFEWDDFGFNGPILPRDAAYDVPDNTQPGMTQTSGYGSTDTGYPTVNLGYQLPEGTTGLTFTVHGVTTTNATGALVVFTEGPFDTTNEMQVSLNGNPPVEIPDPQVQPSGLLTHAISFPASEVVNGTNTMQFTDPGMTTNGYGETIANIDLIVQGAGGTVSP